VEEPTDDRTPEQKARDAIEDAKRRREADRKRRVNSYGILNRKIDLSKEVQRAARAMCNCGAYETVGQVALHKESCPVVRLARSKLR